MSAEHDQYEEKENTEPDNVNVGLVTTVTAVGAILVVSIALALTALVRSEAAAHGAEIGAYADLGTVGRLKAAQGERLRAPPSWADEGKRFVALPITRAMELTTADIQREPALATKWNPADKQEEATPDGGAAESAAQQESLQGEPGAEGATGTVAPQGTGTAPEGNPAAQPGDAANAAKEKKPGKKAPPPQKGATPGTPGPSEPGE
jgi:hypothetical protein